MQPPEMQQQLDFYERLRKSITSYLEKKELQKLVRTYYLHQIFFI